MKHTIRILAETIEYLRVRLQSAEQAHKDTLCVLRSAEKEIARVASQKRLEWRTPTEADRDGKQRLIFIGGFIFLAEYINGCWRCCCSHHEPLKDPTLVVDVTPPEQTP